MDTDGALTNTSALLMILNWMSPTFPIGSFAYSHGLEQAIADGHVATLDDVEQWLSAILHNGSGWNDAVMFARCWSDDHHELNALALALASSAERYAESTQLGRNFNIAAAVWTGNSKRDDLMAYPVAAGSACRTIGLPQDQALVAFLQSFCAAQVAVAVRLVPLGQNSGLVVLRNIAALIAATAKRAVQATCNDVGSNCIAADIAAMRHETLEPRIFRT